MALDPQIALGVTPPSAQPFNPLPLAQAFTQIQTAKALQDQREAIAEDRQAQTQARIQAQADQASMNSALQNAVQSGADDPYSAAHDYLVKSGKANVADQLDKVHAANQKAVWDAMTAQNTAMEGKLKLGSTIIDGIESNPTATTYANGRNALIGMDPDPVHQKFIASQLPDPSQPGFDASQIPQLMQRLRASVQPGADYLKAMQDLQAQWDKPGRLGAFANALALAPDQTIRNADGSAVLGKSDLIKGAVHQGLDTTNANAAMALVNAKATPDQIRQQLGMTPEQQSASANAAAERAQGAARLGIEAGNLAVSQAREAREASATKNLDIGPDVETTALGRKFIDLGKYTPAERKAVRDAAAQLGVTVVADKNAVGHLHDLATARLDQQSVMNDIQSELPKDATGRVLSSPGILMSKVLQTDEARAAFNSWRTTAINTLKALAGGTGSGLRINQAEINMSLQNDIPQLTDTLGVAQKKMANIKTQMDNAETGILGAEKTVKMKAPDGSTADVPMSKVEGFKAKGATVIGG